MADHNMLGMKGEQLAVDHLKNKQYKILARNYRYGHLEVDLICEFNNELVVVEVKTRQSDYLTDPSELISKKKQKDLIRAMNHYIHENEIDLECRFDIVVVISNAHGNEIRHFEDAFYPVL